jgi:hypothetical protein
MVASGISSDYYDLPGEIISAISSDGSTHLFYQQNFQLSDTIFSDWIVISANDSSFGNPERFVEKSSIISHLEADNSENQLAMMFYSAAGSFDDQGFYSSIWNESHEEWNAANPIFIAADLYRFLGIENNEEKYKKNLHYSVCDLDDQVLHIVLELHPSDEKGYYYQVNTTTREVIKEIELPALTRITDYEAAFWEYWETQLVIGNSTNAVIQLGDDVMYYNGTSLTIIQPPQSYPATWRSITTGELLLGSLNASTSTFQTSVLQGGVNWIETSYIVPENWTALVDWETSNGKDFHVVAETEDGDFIYGIINSTGTETRAMDEKPSKKYCSKGYSADLILDQTCKARLGMFTEEQALGIMKLSLKGNMTWVTADEWDAVPKNLGGQPLTQIPSLLAGEGIMVLTILWISRIVVNGSRKRIK